MVKVSAAFFYDESSLTKRGGGYESAIAPVALPLSFQSMMVINFKIKATFCVGTGNKNIHEQIYNVHVF